MHFSNPKFSAVASVHRQTWVTCLQPGDLPGGRGAAQPGPAQPLRLPDQADRGLPPQVPGVQTTVFPGLTNYKFNNDIWRHKIGSFTAFLRTISGHGSVLSRPEIQH